MSLWSFIQATGTTLSPYGSGNDGGLLTTSSAIESILDPFQHAGGIYSLKNDGTTSWLQSADDADYSFGDGTVDGVMSVGAWVLMEEAVGTARSILSKYRTDAVSLREWDFRLDSSGIIQMELFDDSATASEITANAGTALTPFIWQFVVATYDGGETAPVVNLYRNATLQNSGGATTETGAYVAMEDTAALVGVGNRNTPTAAQVFQGRMALPFITGKELTAAEVTTIYGIGRKLLGLTN